MEQSKIIDTLETYHTAPKNRCRIHDRAEQTRPLTGTGVEGRSGFKSDGCFVRPTYCWVYVIWWLIGHYYWGGRTAGCPTLSAKGGTTRLQFSPFLRRRSARAVKTRRLSDYMAHLTLSPYFLDTVRHLTLYIVLPPFLNISLCRDSTRWTTYGTKWMNLHLKCIYIHPYVVHGEISTKTYI